MGGGLKSVVFVRLSTMLLNDEICPKDFAQNPLEIIGFDIVGY